MHDKNNRTHHFYFSILYNISLYGCLRLACGWILWHVRSVDDGRFRRSVCEALCFCYIVQALAVMRAQFTDRHTWLNWVAIIVLSILSAAYGSFRFRRGGNLIKIYELPTSGNLQWRGAPWPSGADMPVWQTFSAVIRARFIGACINEERSLWCIALLASPCRWATTPLGLLFIAFAKTLPS